MPLSVCCLDAVKQLQVATTRSVRTHIQHKASAAQTGNSSATEAVCSALQRRHDVRLEHEQSAAIAAPKAYFELRCPARVRHLIQHVAAALGTRLWFTPTHCSKHVYTCMCNEIDTMNCVMKCVPTAAAVVANLQCSSAFTALSPMHSCVTVFQPTLSSNPVRQQCTTSQCARVVAHVHAR
jgi:hypothetical protein